MFEIRPKKRPLHASNSIYLTTRLSGSPAKSGPTTSRPKTKTVRGKSLVYTYKKAINFSFATSQNSILAEPGLATVIERVKCIDYVKRATSTNLQLNILGLEFLYCWSFGYCFLFLFLFDVLCRCMWFF